MTYTTKDYGLLFLGINQDVYNPTCQTINKSSLYPSSDTMGWNQDKILLGQGNPTFNKPL